ncbi:hypothetical protein [Pediococcus acidilactici]|uniref:hypothetical protein n=1 Tax=Pediococcus acidilactici TaxID=1254 RepID=UPI00198E1B0D|nr:hypothetical protein [Pediococcus acidilactici]WQS07044.1 hypothetical protein SGW12_03055 [Pediococcus acidilactici]GHC33585.1 hypothetical protein GCM10008920_06010 [Pediococcus acidilactici]
MPKVSKQKTIREVKLPHESFLLWCFGSIEIKTPKQLFKDLFILEKDFLVFFKPLFGLE